VDWDNLSEDVVMEPRDPNDPEVVGGLIDEAQETVEESVEAEPQEPVHEYDHEMAADTPADAPQQHLERRGEDSSPSVEDPASGDDRSERPPTADETSPNASSDNAPDAPSGDSNSSDPPSTSAESPSDLEPQPWINLKACRTSCLADEACLQFAWRKDRCAHHYSLRLGSRRVDSTEPDERWVSGWMVDGRVEAFVAGLGDCDAS